MKLKDIPDEEFKNCILNGCLCSDLAIKYNCSENTIWRKKKELGLTNLSNLSQNSLLAKICPICNRKITKCNFEKHYKACLSKQLNNELKNSNPKKKRTAWNKGLTKETCEVLRIQAEKQSNSMKGKKIPEEIREKMKESQKLNHKSGGYRKGSGRGKSGWYKGYWCDSTYELAFVIYNLDHNIQFKRNTDRFPYIYNGVETYYIPDFIMFDNGYVEIKGYETEKDKCKYENFPFKLTVLKQKDLKYAFDYVKNKYDKKLEYLYDNHAISVKKSVELKEKSKKNQEKELYLKEVINSILNSDIDFSKYGWVVKVSKIIGISPQKTGKWMQRNMYDFWLENCYKYENRKN